MSKTNIGLVEFCKQALKGNTGYVYGTLGQICTIPLLDQCAQRYPDPHLAGGPMRTLGQKWLGRRVTDCIGLWKYYMMSQGYGQSPVYNQAYDMSANRAFERATKKGLINTIPEIVGLGLHMDGHIGYYIGGGQVIEARGTYYGVVQTALKDRPWTYWFEIPFTEYVNNIDPNYCDTTVDFKKPLGVTYQFRTAAPIVSGTSTVWQQVSQTRDAKGYYLTKFKAVGKGTAGFYMGIKRVVMGTVV